MRKRTTLLDVNNSAQMTPSLINFQKFRASQNILTTTGANPICPSSPMSPIHLMEKNQDQVFKRLKARHWRAVNPPQAAIGSATTATTLQPLSKARRSLRKRQSEAEAKLKDFLEEKALIDSSQNRTLWHNL